MDREKIFRTLMALPQARSGAILEDDAKEWAERMMRRDPTRVRFHLRRLGGFGGSEAASLVTGLTGQGVTRTPIDQTVQIKLLKRLPLPATDVTERGHRMEPVIRSFFEQQLTESGCRWRRLTDEIARIEAQPHPEFPWLRCSLDDLLEVDGQIWLVDYKCPGEEVARSYIQHGHHIAEYGPQIHHYRIGMEAIGLVPDRMLIACFDLARGARVVDLDVPYDPVLEQNIIEAGTHFWNDNVLKGVVPDVPEDIFAIPEEGWSEEDLRIAEEWITCKILSSVSDERVEKLQKQMKERIAELGRLGSAKAEIGLMHVSAKPQFDMESAIRHLKENHGFSDEDLERLRGAGKIDQDRMATFIRRVSTVIDAVIPELDAAGAPKKVLEKLTKLKDSAPSPEKGDYDPENVRRLLDSCWEIPDVFQREQLSCSLPRGKAYELSLTERKTLARSQLEETLERGPGQDLWMPNAG